MSFTLETSMVLAISQQYAVKPMLTLILSKVIIRQNEINY